MINRILGSSFWAMMVRFICIGLFLGIVGALQPLPIIENGQLSGDTVALSWVQKLITILFHTVGWAWAAWGLSYWRFKDTAPSDLTFFLFPLLSGTLVWCSYFWFIMRPMTGVYPDEAITPLIVFLITGGPMTLLFCLGCRYGPAFVFKMNGYRQP